MTLHALLIAIDHYDPSIRIDGQYAFRPLQGCVRDAKLLLEWLEKDTTIALKAKTLFNSEATKPAIVDAFTQDLAQAKPGDTILIFYSGHGTVEYADPELWAEETDGRLEGLACYYEQGDSGRFVLADKEIRYLLQQITQPEVHICALFDCCHAGDNTRNALESTLERKQSLVTFPQRAWPDFVFSNRFKREDFLGKKLRDILPEGEYIQLAAAESNEPASEAWIQNERHGVFAWHLLEILRQSEGRISYLELCNSIRNQIRYRYGQRVKIYTPPAARELQESGFLRKPLPDYSTGYGKINYNAHENKFLIQCGILDRVVSGQTKVVASAPDGATYQGTIGQVELKTAELRFDQPEQVPKTDLDGVVSGLATRRLRIYFVNKDLPDQEAQALLDEVFTAENASFLVQESDEARADYVLFAWAGMYYLTKPRLGVDDQAWFKPVAMPIILEQAADPARELTTQLQHMAQWHFILELENRDANAIPSTWLKLEVLDSAGQAFDIQSGVATVPLVQGEQKVKIRMANTGNRDLYVGAVLMQDFGVITSFIAKPDGGLLLEPPRNGVLQYETLEIYWDGRVEDHITLGIDDYLRLFNHAHTLATFKFFVALKPIAGLRRMALDSLPMPDKLIGMRGGQEEAKGLVQVNQSAAALPDDSWNALRLDLCAPNPDYNSDNLLPAIQPHLDPSTGSPYLAHFLTGIYLQSSGGLGPSLVLREPFVSTEPADLGLESAKGVITDTLMAGANVWANFWRNQRFKRMTDKYKDLPKIVSEGDSWFQHPLLDDIIDNIGRVYPTFCVAAAGDTMRHWIEKEEYLRAIRKEKPRVLVLSGGGNDILGDDMPKFLTQFTEGDEGENPDRFFNQAFRAELEKIAGYYRRVFQQCRDEFQDMFVLVHTYDYPRPKPSGAGEFRNWLGQYFDDFGITRPGDRQQAVVYMIDAFHDHLKPVADDFAGQVHFLDLRHLVREHQWDDEIHPNNSGFQVVSGAFMRKIQTLLQP